MQAWMKVVRLVEAEPDATSFGPPVLDEVVASSALTEAIAGPISTTFYAVRGVYRIGDLIQVTISDP